ncbi:MAG: RNA polymerase sigma factor [Deltaproteobacteria bacterium]|nr:RNA polymerase sigma factor [Deltaproteobacteria bacterium]
MNERRNIRAVGTSGAQPDDDRLMTVLATGEMYPLAELYARYGRTVRMTIRRFAPEISEAEAEELGQDVFLALVKSAGRYEGGDRLRAWLAGIAVNKARGWRRTTWLRRNLLRRHHRDEVGIFAVQGSALDTEVERRDELRQALARLPAAQREVLLLSVVEGFTGEEIGRILGIRPKTVWTRLHRARRAMTRTLTDDDAAAGVRGEK